MATFPRTVCTVCGTTCVRGPNYSRDYAPVRVILRLKPDPTSYIVTPELERLTVRIQSLNAGKQDYAIDIPLWDVQAAFILLDADDRIEQWNTCETDDVCEEHLPLILERKKRLEALRHA